MAPTTATSPHLLGVPTGLGTSAARVGWLGPTDRPPAPTGTYPELEGPGPVRDDDALGAAVDARLVAWAGEVGIYAGRLDDFAGSRFGRLAMLAHPDSDDVDQLLLAARWMAALFALDDYYCDDERAGAVLEKVGPRLTVALSALEEPHLLDRYRDELHAALAADPVLVAIADSLGHIARQATPAQLARIRHETAAMFVVMNAEAAWRYTGELPQVWEFLASRQPNSFLPCMTVIDVVGGYEVPPDVYSHPQVRRATGLAASATVLVNDLYSLGRDDAAGTRDFNLPSVMAAAEGCSLHEAVKATIAIHNQVIGAFEETRQSLSVVPSPALQRWLLGLRAWVGGSRAWHEDSVRYSTK